MVGQDRQPLPAVAARRAPAAAAPVEALALAALVPLSLTPVPLLTVLAAGSAVVILVLRRRHDPAAYLVGAACLGGVASLLLGWAWQVGPALGLGGVMLAWVWRNRGAGILSRLGQSWRPDLTLRSVAASTAIVTVASGFLLVYFDRRGTFTFTVLPMALLVLIPLGNAVLEEAIWRGAVLGALVAARLPVAVVLAVQALSFGFAHWTSGFPSGWSGALASAVFGLSVGWIAVGTRSLLVPIVIHWIIDMVIFFSLFR